MANKAIEDAVDDLIRKGRIADTLRAEYIAHFEKNLSNDLLRGADYTQKTQRLAAERREAEAKIREEYTKLQTERQELQKWQGQVQQDLDEYGRVIRQMPELTAKVAAYEQIMKDYSVPMDQVVIPTTVQTQEQVRKVPTMTQTAPETPQNGLTREEAAAYIRDLTILNGKASRINAQHMKLYGEPLEDDLVTHFLATGQDMEEHWRVKYGVDARKAEIAAKQREAEVAKIREEERQKILSEITADPSRVVGGQPFQRTGGLSPHLEQYMGSRATAHSKEALGEHTPESVPPEKIPQLAAQQARVRAASEMYLKNFDPSGNPITDEGKRMYQKHFVTDQY